MIVDLNYMSPFIYNIWSLFCVFAGSRWLPNPSCASGCSQKQKKKKDCAVVQFQRDGQQPKPFNFNIEWVTAPGSTTRHL